MGWRELGLMRENHLPSFRESVCLNTCHGAWWRDLEQLFSLFCFLLLRLKLIEIFSGNLLPWISLSRWVIFLHTDKILYFVAVLLKTYGKVYCVSIIFVPKLFKTFWLVNVNRVSLKTKTLLDSILTHPTNLSGTKAFSALLPFWRKTKTPKWSLWLKFCQ